MMIFLFFSMGNVEFDGDSAVFNTLVAGHICDQFVKMLLLRHNQHLVYVFVGDHASSLANILA